MTTATESAPRKTLRQLRESADTLFCKNNTANKITCNTHEVRFELDPFEIRIMPKECLNAPGMQRLWMKKLITISDDVEMENQIMLHMGGQVSETIPKVQVMNDDGTWSTQTPQVEKKSGHRDIVMPIDNDPNSRTYGQPKPLTCVIGGEAVFMTREQIDMGVPPLCQAHAGETHRLVSIQNENGTWSHKLPTIG